MSERGEGIFPGAPGIKFYYQWWRPVGSAARAALAAVRGPGELGELYELIIGRLVPRGYSLYLFDHRELRRLPGQQGYIEEWGECLLDVDRFVQTIARHEPSLPRFLLGNCVGGLMALSHALHEPDGLSGVIALAPSLPGDGSEPLALSSALPKPARLARKLSHIWPVSEPAAGLARPAVDVRRVGSTASASEAEPAGTTAPPAPSSLPLSGLVEIGMPYLIVNAHEAPTQEGVESGLVARLEAWLDDLL